MAKIERELAEKHIVIEPSTKRRLKIWMAQNDQNTWNQAINKLLETQEKKV